MALELIDEEDLELPKDLTEFISFLGFILTEHKVDVSIFKSTILKELLKLIEQELKDRDENSVIH